MRHFSQQVLLIGTMVAAGYAQTPAISAAGILNGATLTRTNLAPGSIVTIFGENLAASPIAASVFPAPQTLGGVSVTFDGRPGAMLYVGPRQINVQAPWSALEVGQATRNVSVVVSRDGQVSSPMNVMFGTSSPGLFTLNGSGTGMAVAMNASDGSYSQPTGTVAGAASRAARIGSVVSLYGTGLGGVTPSLATGQVSRDLFRRSRMAPEVLIGGRPATVLYSGLAADIPGVNQLNVVIPGDVAAGASVPVQIRIGGVTSPTGVTIAVDGGMEPATPLPGANAAEIWSYVDRQNYKQNFSLIPGKDQLYQGIAPHAQLLTVVINPTAREAIERRTGTMPPGSIILKDAHGPSGDPTLTYVMMKIPGFDPANGDWYWSTRRPNGTIGNSGSIAGCYNCHNRAPGNDGLFLATPAPDPAPTAAAVRDYIARQNYRETWRLFPGTTANQASMAPHGATVSVYVNERAFDALQNGDGRMPAGAFLIKENFMPDRTLAALTVMYKSPGFDAANNDWFWLQQLPDGTARASGRVEACSTCHSQVKSNDYVYLGSLNSRPEPTAAAVWSYVTSQDYQKNWKLFPGTTAQMPGNMPHGALISTYVNRPALEAITAKRGKLPPGAIVIKENYMPDRTLAAVTLMYKSPGFDPDRGDWFWLQRLANGTVAAQGRVAGCANCHAAAAENDFIQIGSLR